MTAGRLMLDLSATQLDQDELELLQQPNVGGVILFARNLKSAAQAAELCGEIRALRPELLLAVDQEGGRVQRLQEGLTRLPPLGQLGCLYARDSEVGLQASRLLGRLMATEVLDLGFDFSFAPVLDVDYGVSQVIGDRAFTSQIEHLIVLADAYIDGMQDAGMAAIGKHYPGHGYVGADSHTHLPIDVRSFEDIQSTCLQPFAALAKKLQGIMPAHVIYSAVDQQPAGYSRFWLDYLRDELAFTGMVFSDDLGMQAASVAGSFAQRAEMALAAGCDQVLVCNNRAAALQVLDWMETQNCGPSAKAATMHARLPATQDWLESPEALLARQVAGFLVEQDVNSALHSFSVA